MLEIIAVGVIVAGAALVLGRKAIRRLDPAAGTGGCGGCTTPGCPSRKGGLEGPRAEQCAGER